MAGSPEEFPHPAGVGPPPGPEGAAPDGSAPSGLFARFLRFVEWLGNLLPHPVTLFALFALAIVVISGIAEAAGLAVADPPARRRRRPRRGRDDPGGEPGLRRGVAADRREPGDQLHRVRAPGHGPGGALGRRRGRALGPAVGGDPPAGGQGAAAADDAGRRVRRRRLEHRVRDGLRGADPVGGRRVPRARAAPAGGDGGGVRRCLGRLLRQPAHRHRGPAAGGHHPGGGPAHRPRLRGPRGGELLLHGREHVHDRRRRDLGHAPLRRAPARDLRPGQRRPRRARAAPGPALACRNQRADLGRRLGPRCDRARRAGGRARGRGAAQTPRLATSSGARSCAGSWP